MRGTRSTQMASTGVTAPRLALAAWGPETASKHKSPNFLSIRIPRTGLQGGGGLDRSQSPRLVVQLLLQVAPVNDRPT